MASLNASIQAFSKLPALPNTSESEQESFVIVEQSLEPQQEQSLEPQVEQSIFEATEVIPVAERNGIMSVQSTTSSEFPSVDIQDKVHELIEENTSLKKTLSENNRSLKAQRDVILNWQDEVKQVLDDNKKQFKEAKNYIEELKNEKANLIEQCESMKKIQLTQQATKDLEDLMKQLSAKDAEIKQQRAELAELKAEINKQESTQLQSKANDDSTKEALKRFEIQENEAIAKNEALQAQNTKLQADFEGSLETINSLSTKLEQAEDEKKKLQLQNKSLNKELNVKVSAMQLIQLQVDATKTKLLELEAKPSIDVEYAVVENAEKEIASLKKKLDSSNKYNEQLKVENGLLAQQEIASKEQLANVQSELISVQLKNAQLKNELVQIQQHFDEQTRNLQKTIDDKEEVCKIQLEVYKVDFETERAAREELKTERDQLAEDFANIQRRNRELQEEIELVREQTEFYVAPQPQRSSPPPTEYRCPICAVKFRTFKLLEEHVDTCTQFTN